MEENYKEAGSSDLIRYGKRLQGYLPALKAINDDLVGKEIVHIDEFLKYILPSLQTAFRSDIAFIADNAGKIFHVEPVADKKSLIGKELKGTKRFKSLIEEGKPLVVDAIVRMEPELEVLNVDSLMCVRMETTEGINFLGVVNGKNKPAPYLSEDRILFDELIKIISNSPGFNYIKKAKYDSYHLARLRGEWGSLSIAAQDYAKLLTHELMIYGEHKGIYKQLDRALSDYLEAELSLYIIKTPQFTQDQELPLNKKGEKKKAPEQPKPWDLIGKIDDKGNLTNVLRINKLPIADYPHTALTAARIFLVELYFDKNKERELIKNIDNILEKVEESAKRINCQLYTKSFKEEEKRKCMIMKH